MQNQNFVQKALRGPNGEYIKQLSVQNFEVVFNLDNVLTEGAGFMQSELAGRINVKEQFSANIELEVQIPLSSFHNAMRNEDADSDFTARLVQSDVALVNANVWVRDYGVIDELVTFYAENLEQSVTTGREDIRLQIDQKVTETIPNEAPRFLMAVDKFIRQGGQLGVSFTPDAPVPFLNFVGYLMMPEGAIKQLNIKTEWMK
jgi:hypothetical protein